MSTRRCRDAERDTPLDVRERAPASPGARLGTPRPDPAAATRTIDRRPRYPPQPLAGRRLASPTTPTNASQHLIPGHADLALTLQTAYPSVHLSTLGFRELTRR